MAAFYFDTSGIVKRYVQETGTAWVQSVADPVAGNLIYLARLSTVELASAVTRRQRSGSLSVVNAKAILGQFRQDMVLEYRIIEITSSLLTGAMAVAEVHGLRANDAIHLAVVAELHAQRLAAGLDPLILVSSDKELNSAATALGLLVEDPNLHP